MASANEVLGIRRRHDKSAPSEFGCVLQGPGTGGGGRNCGVAKLVCVEATNARRVGNRSSIRGMQRETRS